MSPISRVLVTGANGFVGRAACRHLMGRGWLVRGAVRALDDRFPAGAEVAVVGNIDETTDWRVALAGVEAIVHLAARVHVMRDVATDPLSEFRKANVFATLNLARQAAAAGVRRFVFISTAKVMGEGRAAAYSENDVPAPEDPYAISKQEAEEGLRRIATECGMELVVLRPPLVYGPGVAANFLRLMRWVEQGIPLPFAAIRNRRSLVYVDNLADGIRACLEHDAAPGNAFLIADGEDVSTAELIERLAAALGRRPRIYAVPAILLETVGRMLGRADEMKRLLGSMCVDSSLLRRTLAWSPPFGLDEGLRETVRRIQKQ